MGPVWWKRGAWECKCFIGWGLSCPVSCLVLSLCFAQWERECHSTSRAPFLYLRPCSKQVLFTRTQSKVDISFELPFWLVAFLFALGLYILSHFILRFNFAFTMFSLEAGHYLLLFTFRNQVYTPGSPDGLRPLGWVWLETWEGVQLTLQTADRKVIIWRLTLSAFKTALPPWLRGACRDGGSSTQI